uniref:Integrase catalytic domain-containing protein n=1 Tax=Peronospora matthiolae TaxID=2874970 RepID=A0AAV1VMR1_9STRA
MDFVFGLPKDLEGNTVIVVFVERSSKMAHLAAVPDSIDAEGTAKLFIDRVFRQQGLPVAIVSDRDPRFTGDLTVFL